MTKFGPAVLVAVLVIATTGIYVKFVRHHKPSEVIPTEARAEQPAREKAPAASTYTPDAQPAEPEGQQESAQEVVPEMVLNAINEASSESKNKTVYLSGYLRSEVQWQMTKTLRENGYTVAPRKSSKALTMHCTMKRIGGSYICTIFLCDTQGSIIAQGRGEAAYAKSKSYSETEKTQSEASVSAAIAAVEEMMSDQEGTTE